MSKQYRASVRGLGGSPTLEGRYRGFDLGYAPVWHPDADGGRQCAGLVRVVTVTIRLDQGKDDPVAALDGLIKNQVDLRLTGLSLRGWIVTAAFRQEADVQGRPTGATVEFRIEGVKE